MKKIPLFLIIVAIAIVFTSLFYQKSIGINLLIFEMIAIPIMFFRRFQTSKSCETESLQNCGNCKKFNHLTCFVFAVVVVSAVSVVMINSAWSIFINILSMICLSGMFVYQGFRSFIHAFIESFLRCFSAQWSIFCHRSEKPQKSYKRVFSKIFFFIILPLIIVLFFVMLYATGSSAFEKIMQPIFNQVFAWLENVNLTLFFVFILGIIFANILYVKTKEAGLHQLDMAASDRLIRQRRKHLFPFSKTGLLLQYRSGIVLLICLNLLILFFNILDIKNIWFGFEWKGDFLKEFIHEGTWILLFSIFVSAAIALYFFKGNLNFFSKNIWLKRLTVLWLLQNIVMTVSVVIRNFWYVYYFGLAYKRIAVFFFLLLTIVGIATIIIKILKVKSSFYLWRINSLALLIVLFVTVPFNWDVMIAKFNFAHYDRSFIEYRFMYQLNNSALPYTLKTDETLQKIDSVQQQIMPFDIHKPYLWSIDEYQEYMTKKRETFLKNYENQHFLEWNFADHRTFKRLSEMD